MGKSIDFYFVTISPWSYLGMGRLRAMARRQKADIRYKPVDLPRIFETVGYQPFAKRPPALLANRLNELRRWKDHLNAEINIEPRHFPVDAALSLGAIIAAQHQGNAVDELTLALMRACWVEERDISDPDTLIAIANDLGFNGNTLIDHATSDAVLDQLATNTDDAISRSAMGVPTYVVEGESFFGQDRLEFVERRLAGGASHPAYLIGQIRVNDPELWERYVEGVAHSLEPHGAQVLFRGKRNAILAGQSDKDLAVVIRFQDQTTLRNWFESRQYQELIPIRDQAADTVSASYDVVL